MPIVKIQLLNQNPLINVKHENNRVVLNVSLKVKVCTYLDSMLLIFSSDSTKDTFLKDLATSLLEVSCHVRGKYGPLCCITSAVGATKMLLWFPKLPHGVFPLMKDRCLVPHVSDQIKQIVTPCTTENQ